MRALLLSDLHLEHAALPAPRHEADVVFLAGDIDIGIRGVEWAKDTFSVPVFYVPGNHEEDDLQRDLLLRMQRAAEGSHVRILDNRTEIFSGLRIIGATLWTDGLLLQNNIPLTRRIITDPELTRRHLASVRYIRNELSNPFPGSTVVITHHAPSFRSVPDRFKDDELSAQFASNLDDLVRGSGAALWHHGHTHDSREYFIGSTRVICNPRGYPGNDRNPAFSPSLIIEI